MKQIVRGVLLAGSLLVFNLPVAQAQQLAPATSPAAAPGDESGETSVVKHEPPSSGPIVLNWKLKKLDGTMNLTVNPDGTYLFSGSVKDKKPGRDMDMSVALKSSLGGVITFTNVSDVSDGAEWSKQGQSEILKDNFATFAGKHDWTWAYRLPLSSEGRAKLYKEEEEKKAKLKKEEEEAKQKHDEKVAAEKKAEREKQEKERIQQAQEQQAAAQRQQQSGGGGSSVGSVLETIGTVAGAILACF
jgi:hypothetical protein